MHGLITSFVVFGKKSRRAITMLQPGMIYLCMLVRAGGNHTVYNHYAAASIYACVHGIVWELICQCFKMVGLRYLLLWGNNWLWPRAISDGSLSLEAYFVRQKCLVWSKSVQNCCVYLVGSQYWPLESYIYMHTSTLAFLCIFGITTSAASS